MNRERAATPRLCPACEDHQCRVAILDADGTNAGDNGMRAFRASVSTERAVEARHTALSEHSGPRSECRKRKDQYKPFKLLGVEPKPVGSATESLLLDAVRYCLAVADDQVESADALRRIRARLKKALSAIDAA